MRVTFFALLLLLAGCGTDPAPAPAREAGSPPPDSPSSAPQGRTVTVVEEAPAPASDSAAAPSPRKSVSITSIEGTNPLRVRGLARTFENAVSIRVRTGDGPLATTYTTATGELGQFNPWSVEVWLTRMPASPRLVVEAIDYSAKDGSIASLDAREVALPRETTTLSLTFPLDDCTRFGTFQRAVPKTVSVARVAVEALVAGPSPQERASGASSAFPQGSAVRSVILRDGTLTVDFNERLQNVGGSCAAAAVRESVTRTLSALPNVNRVAITAAGSGKLALQP